MILSPLGDAAVMLELGSETDESVLARVRALAAVLERDRPAGVMGVVPAFTTVTVFYDLPRVGGYEQLCAELKTRAGRVLASSAGNVPGRTIEIPVCYGQQFGPDLAEVAAGARLSLEETIALHSGAEYRVLAVGFTPGFPYLGGLPAKLQTPRRATPRLMVPGGSVAIGGSQTGIYPQATPGGWNLIGRTPLLLFRAKESPAALLEVGDRVKFRRISAEEFVTWK